MSLVGRVGRKRTRARLAMLIVYGVLCLGALTTLYPFLVMVSDGLKGPTDQNDNHLIPAYFSQVTGKDSTGAALPETLLGKYLADKYAGDVNFIESTRIGADAKPEEIAAYKAFLMTLPLDSWTAAFRTSPSQSTGRLSIRYENWLQGKYGTIEALDRAYTEQNTAFQQVVPPPELLEQKVWEPVHDRKYVEWQQFKATLPAEFRNPVRLQHMFQSFLASKYKNQLDLVPKAVVGNAKSLWDIQTPASGPDWTEFRATRLPDRFASQTVESLWRKAGHPGPLPIAGYEDEFVQSHASAIRDEFATRNFTYVLGYLVLKGRVLLNTFIFCALAVLVQLTVNPLAAYALSRYPIRASSKILLFLLATMAFPAEVAMIPAFLLLKSLGLLNTFAALVLPTAASGYMIFLLKGFFDSLPKELFEAGEIDGAREMTLMRKIALPLSGPVLGYMALLAFMSAYGAFMYAFLVAQDQRIWTLMVWIYQLQGSAPKSVMMAALTLAAIPTVVVFLLAQRVIMQGIVLPGER